MVMLFPKAEKPVKEKTKLQPSKNSCQMNFSKTDFQNQKPLPNPPCVLRVVKLESIGIKQVFGGKYFQGGEGREGRLDLNNQKPDNEPLLYFSSFLGGIK
jgi:hypothetical protein